MSACLRDTHPFAIRGVVEGFYGAYYTFPERNDLIRFLGRQGYNLYVYGPKNDRQHRTRWWEPYPPAIMQRFAQTVATAQKAGLTFCYALAPISYAGDGDFEQVTAKLGAFFDRGVRAFSILVDDLSPPHEQEQGQRDYLAYAETHITICNRVYAWLQTLDPACTLSMCPTDYHGSPPFSDYLRRLGQELHPAIDIFYTGPQVCSPTIRRADTEALAAILRRPPLIWDNYPVNDLSMRAELHLGPIRGRDPELAPTVRGIVVNPMLQPEASKIALLTYAEYLRDPLLYSPDSAWQRALRHVGGTTGQAALRQFAETSLESCLGTPLRPQLTWLTEATLADLKRGETTSSSPPARNLLAYLNSLDEACYALKYHGENQALRRDLLPWIEALEDWLWLGRRALQVLREIAEGADPNETRRLLDESLQQVRSHNKRSGGAPLLALATFALNYNV